MNTQVTDKVLVVFDSVNSIESSCPISSISCFGNNSFKDTDAYKPRVKDKMRLLAVTKRKVESSRTQ